jgi:hypothetical protein
MQRVFVLNARMCSVAATINSVDPFGRDLLILHHVERLAVGVLADTHGVSVDDIRRALAEAEGQFVEILRGLSGMGRWDRAGRRCAVSGVGGLHRPALGGKPG